MEKIDNSPLVSFVVPIYKVEDVIEHTVKSIIKQTYRNIEVVLVDDGSPDNSVAVASKLLQETNIKWKVISQKNSGLPTARNVGIQNANGEWVICPDSDDVLAPQAIETMLQAAIGSSVDCVFCGFKNVYDDNYDSLPEHEGGVNIFDMPKLRKLFINRELILLVPGMLLRKSYYDIVQFDRDCPHDEDIHFMWQLFYELDKVAYVDSDYYNYYIRGTSMSHSLKPENYIKTSQRYTEMTKKLSLRFPHDEIIPLIYPKYRLGGLHVLARSADYKTFKETVIKDGYRRDMGKLILHRNLKLSVYALIFCICLPLFYKISK